MTHPELPPGDTRSIVFHPTNKRERWVVELISPDRATSTDWVITTKGDWAVIGDLNGLASSTIIARPIQVYEGTGG